MNNKNKKSCLFIKKIFFLILMLCFEKISFAVGKNRATQYIHYTHNKILSKRRKSQKNATDKNNKANKFHPLLLASGGDSGTISIWSNSFNFAKSKNSEVDPRTGTLLVSVKAGLLLSNFGHGPDIDLEMNYNSSAKSNPDGLGHGWTWNLTHYNPVTHQLNTSAGKSFFLQQQSDGSWFPQYHKLKDVIITSKKGHLIITSANGLRDILNSDGYEIRLEQQNGEGVNFSYVPGSHLLQKITDDYGHSITLTRKDGYLIVTSYDVQGKPENVHISLNNNQVRNIWFPKNNNQQITDSSRVIHLSYGSNYYDQDLLTDIHYFTGMEKKFTYDCQYAMKLPAISNSKNSFHSFTPMCVVRQVEMIPGTNQPPMTINYRYTSVNSNDHDYLAYNSGLNEMPGLKTDLLFEAPASYTYKTEEDNGRVKVVRTYNKYHLLIDKKTISDQSGQLLYETKAYFCRTDTEDGCANTSFNQLPPTYSLPLKVVTTSWGENSSAPAVSVTKRSYDDNGRIISKTDSYGRRTEITYCPQYGDNHCPAAPHDWPVVSLKEGIKNFPASVKKGMQLSPVITSMYYKKEDNINKQGYTLVLYKKTVKHGTMQRTEIRQYYNNSSNHLTYGLLKQKELSGTNLPTSSVHKITHHYQYILNNNGTETISGYTDVANHQPVLSKVIEKSLFFPKTLRVTSADKQNIHTFTYDEMSRVIARTDAVSTPFETTTHYQYTLSKDKNNVIVTTPDGMHKKIVFDGLGRILGTYIEKTDLQGHFQSGLWQQQTQTRYNAAGKVAEKTRYIDNGQNRGISAALTTYFDYDVLGRLTKKYLPDGETEVTQYDDAHRCIIHYTTDRQNHRTAVIIDRNNVTGKPVEKIILPATSGILPTVTTLCTRGDQQPNAKVSIMTYDGFDRLIKTEDPMGRIVQYRYDASGHISDTINPVGDKLHNVYDLTGHIIQHEMIPAKGGDYLLASAGFNAAGQKLWSAGEDGKKTTYHYNINGQLSDSYKPNGHHISLFYNIIGLPVKDELDGQLFLQVNYDHVNHKPLTVTDNTGVTTYHYRDDGLLKTVIHKGINGYPNTFYTLAYDSYHRLVSRTNRYKDKITYIFDALGRPTGKKYQVNKGNSILIEHSEYNHLSRIIKKIYGSGMVRTLSYDPWGQVHAIRDNINKKSLYTVSFSYDADGNITCLQRSDDENHHAIINYSYDRLDNLTTMNCQGDNILCPHDTTFSSDHLTAAPVIIQQNYNFTPLNRIKIVTEKLIDASSSQRHSLSKTMTYDYSDIKTPLRLTSVSTQWNNQQPDTHHFMYDATGNMIIDGEGNKISYNPFNQIKQVVNTTGIVSSYDYDGQGKAVKVVTARGTLRMVYQGKSLSREIVTDTDNDVHNIGYPAAETETTDNTITDWYESNYKGDVISVLKKDKTSGQWTVKQHKTYSPYGMVWSYDKNNKKISLFQQILKGFDGEITDPATGWQFLGAGHRTYNPDQRYFVSEDPAGDGYAFGSNNPVMNSDPSGNMPKWLGKMFKLANNVFSLGMNKVHNKFLQGIGRAWIWGAMGLGFGPTLAIGLAFAAPATLAFASAIKPANKGLQMASMATGMVYSGALFVAGIIMGVGLAEAAATSIATILKTLTGLGEEAAVLSEEAAVDAESSCSVLAESSQIAETSEELAVSDSAEITNTETASDDSGIAESPDGVKRAVFCCGNEYAGFGDGRCAHPEPWIDTFDTDMSKGADYTVDLTDPEAVTAETGENVYDEILQEYMPMNFFETAYRLLRPGGKFYIMQGNMRTDSESFEFYTTEGKKLFNDVRVISSQEVKLQITSDFTTKHEPSSESVILEFRK